MTLVMRLICVLCLAVSPCLGQSETRIPLKEIVIYLDNSQSIVNEKDNRPSVQLARMLMDALSRENGFLNDNDTISIVNFGDTLHLSQSRTRLAGRERDLWGEAVAYFSAPRKGDSRTNLTNVLAHMGETAAQPTSDGQIRVFILASDLVHDPRDEVRSSELDTRAKTSAVKNQLENEVYSALLDLKNRVSADFTANQPRNFLLLLKVPPLVTSSSSNNYREVAFGLADGCASSLKRDLDATVQIYKQQNGREIAQNLLRKITQWLRFQVEGIEQINGRTTLRLRVENPNSFPVELKEIGLAVNEMAEPVFKPINAQTIHSGDRNFLDLDLEPWDTAIQQSDLFIYSKQTPEPMGIRRFSKAPALSWSSVSLNKVKPVLLGKGEKTLVIRFLASLNYENAARTSVPLRFWLESAEAATNGTQTNVAPQQETHNISLINGRAQQEISLIFTTGPGLDTGRLEDYVLVAQTEDEPPTFSRTLLNRPNTLTYQPGRNALIVSSLLMLVLLGISQFTGKERKNRGPKDPLVWVGATATIGSFFVFWMAGAGISDIYHLVFACCPTLLFWLISFQLLTDRFNAAKVKADEIVEDMIFRHMVNSFWMATALALVVGYLATKFFS